MFLSQRATQAEYYGRPDLPLEELADNYRQLARFNRMMLVADPFQRLLVRWLGRMNATKLTPHFLFDGLQSIRRGWRVGDWRKLAEEAGSRMCACGSITARA